MKGIFSKEYFFCLLGMLVFTQLIAGPKNDKGDYPKDFFRAPVEGDVRLSGTFGELRSNHFHSGIDIKGFRGRKIVSAAEGYIYRINVRAGGYGNGLYIKHPNGYITVYGHMNSYAPEIAAFVAQWQAENKQFEMDYYPDSTEFQLAKGQQVGTMGNTGYSFGPHLHFEIREAATDNPINPLLFGIQVPDQQKPLMNQLRIFGLDEQTLTTQKKTYDLQSAGSGRYKINADTILVNSERAGIGIKTYDLMDAVRNWNGVYKIEMLVDGVQEYEIELDQFSFEEWAYLNAHVDYQDVQENKSYFNRCYQMPGNHFSAYETKENRGVLTLNENKAKRIEIVVSDFKDNQSRLGFWLKKAPGPLAKRETTFNYFLPHQQENQINNYYLYLKFPEGSFYEDLEMQYHFEQEQGANIFSTTHAIHQPLTPIHKNFEISIRPSLVPEQLRSKAFIARCSPSNRITNCGGEWEAGMLKTRVGSFGDYVVMIDTVPPNIRSEDFRYDLRGRKNINFKASDDIGTAGPAHGLRYQASIDGQWVLLTYDLKYDRFTHQFSGDLSTGEHLFRLEITDDRDNTAVFEQKFRR
jgi:hypothetical protein